MYSKKPYCHFSLCLLGFFFYVFSACTDKDVGKIYFSSEGSKLDSPTVSIVINTVNKDDQTAIFNYAKQMVVSVDGFLQTLDLRVAFSKVGDVYVSLPFKVFANKQYIVKQCYLIDPNGTIVAVAPITGSLWSYNITQALPYTFKSGESGNTNVNLTFFPAIAANVQLTGYSYALSQPPSLPFLKFQVEVRDNGDFENFIVSSLTLKRKANGTVIRTKQISNTGIFQIQDLYYYDEKDVFVFEVDGYTKSGYKQIKKELNAFSIYTYYDVNNPDNNRTDKSLKILL